VAVEKQVEFHDRDVADIIGWPTRMGCGESEAGARLD
jgi:hypothetical protein